MKLKITIVSFVLLFSLLGFPSKDYAEELSINPQLLTIEQQIVYFSTLYGADSNIVLKVMECESGGNHQVTGDGGRSNGIFQFQRSTFNRMEKILGEDLNYDSQFDQVKLASFALSKPELAREWSSFRSIKNGGKYSFWSNQMQRHYTVYCKL